MKFNNIKQKKEDLNGNFKLLKLKAKRNHFFTI